MDSYTTILSKLNQFNRRYYTQMLVRGLLVFTTLGLLILLAVTSVEYFLWLPQGGRMFLFTMVLLAEGYLFIRFIIRPLLYLLRFRTGISHKQASLLIGNHFPEVKDKLYNLFDLAEDDERSELLLASIEQRSRQLTAIPFYKAIDLTRAWRYSKYMVLPALVVGAIWLSGNIPAFLSSYKRVVNYDMAYQPPSPFVFEVLIPELNVLESKPVTVQVRTKGSVRPENIKINIEGREYMMQEENGLYQYTFEAPLQLAEFYFIANGINSERYTLNPLKVPVLDDFVMELKYPEYLNRPSDVVKSTGNAVIPEGTRAQWTIKGRNITALDFKTADTVLYFDKVSEGFRLAKQILHNLSYEIGSTNDNVEDYEVLRYQLNVVRDANPEIVVRELKDSLDPLQQYFTGEVSDDYLVTKIEVTAYPEGDFKSAQKRVLLEPGKAVEQFYYLFPSGFDLSPGVNYELFFTVTDNDGLRNGKSVNSRVFKRRVLNESEIRDRQLNAQDELIRGFGKSLNTYQEDSKDYERIRQKNREKSDLNFREQKEILDFLDRQKQQEQMMEKFSRELKENLKDQDGSDELNRLLQERLERKELEARKNAELLEELKRMADKIDKEELTQRLEELGKQRQNNQRSLEQILELTKRYYVTERASQLARELEKLATQQEELIDREGDKEQSESLQEQLNEEFNKKANDIEELIKENANLKKPLKIDVDRDDTQAVKEEQKSALDNIRKLQQQEKANPGSRQEEGNKVKSSQKRAGDKMKEISEGLQQSSGGASESSMAEDAEMLRQILDNLITFSFKQENLFEQVEKEAGELANYSDEVRKQQELKQLFRHIDDSLFSLSLRRAELSDFVNEQITEVYYNMDKALESISEDRIYQGVSQQQYVLTAANTLADFLAGILDNMQQSLAMGSGAGNKDQGFQLPDIIQSQGDLKEKAGELGKQGQNKEGAPGEGMDKRGEQGGKDGEGVQKDGQDKGRGNGGSGTEGQLKELYEIYKQQQQIRMALEQQLKDLINEEDRQLGGKILKQMEDFENELLENGITERSIERLNRIEHELLKLENATLRQGEKDIRESKTNTETYSNPIITKPRELDNYREQIEILNRQALPLQHIFQEKVKSFFKEDDRIPLSDGLQN